MSDSPIFENDHLAMEIETAAVEMARGAGALLAECFGRQLTIEYKDKNQLDPVTSADKDTQQYLEAEISRRFPDHGILGEEILPETSGDSAGESAGRTESDDPAPDFLWVLDPLDGTTNFLNGLPIYAVSIGVLYRGEPVAGSLFLPWPEKEGGIVAHARKGGGAYFGEREAHADPEAEPQGHRLVAVPGHFDMRHSFRGELRSRAGEPRVLGSIAYELAMTACGVMQYSIFGAPRMWDMAAGVLTVMEAQGAVLTRFRGEKRYHPLGSLVPS